MITRYETRRLGTAVGLTLAAWATGCSSTDTDPLSPADSRVRIIESVNLGLGPSDPFEVVGHSLQSDILRIDVRYSGGCATHEFVGLVGSDVAESFPVQMWGRLAHDDADDPCDAIVSGSVTLDLSPVRELYEGLYGPGAATVVLHMEPIEQELRYNF